MTASNTYYRTLAPAVTELPLNGLVINASDSHVHLGSMTDVSSLEEPITPDFKRWIASWDEKIHLVRMKMEGRDWEYIIKVFWKKDKTNKKGLSGWQSMWQRTAHDIELLGKAALIEREGEVDRLSDLMSDHSMVDAALVDYEGIWDRISDLMDKLGTQLKWTPDKVAYAWTHGVSDIYPDIVLRQRQFHNDVSTDFLNSWTCSVSECSPFRIE